MIKLLGTERSPAFSGALRSDRPKQARTNRLRCRRTDARNAAISFPILPVSPDGSDPHRSPRRGVRGVSPLAIPCALHGVRIRAILARVCVLSPFEGAEPVLDPLDHFRQAGEHVGEP